jgi:hypothetical protein
MRRERSTFLQRAALEVSLTLVLALTLRPTRA